MDPRIAITLRIVEEQRESTQLALKQTSAMLGLSQAYLLRLFHRETGKTFRRHLRDVRMIRAAQLVERNDLSIKQIAIDCGYSDVGNFYRDFKMVHGYTPREVRLRALTAIANVKPSGAAPEAPKLD